MDAPNQTFKNKTGQNRNLWGGLAAGVRVGAGDTADKRQETDTPQTALDLGDIPGHLGEYRVARDMYDQEYEAG